MSASGGAGGPRVQRLFDRAANAESLGRVIFTGLGAVLLAIGGGIAGGVLTIADVFIVPANAFINAVGALITAVFGGSARIIDFGSFASALSIGPDGLFASPLSFPIAVGIVLLTFYVILAYVSEEETTNFFPLVGSGWDVPTPGWLDAEEENDE